MPIIFLPFVFVLLFSLAVSSTLVTLAFAAINLVCNGIARLFTRK